MSLIIRAAQIANSAHHTQLRKWTNRPFIEHPMRVAGRVATIDGVTESVVAAAWLHDVFEDHPNWRKIIENEMPPEVCSLIDELTNKKDPNKNRAERKAEDRERLAKVSRWAKIIKLVDRADNIAEMSDAEEEFKMLYCGESRLLADALLDESDMTIFVLHGYLVGEIEKAEGKQWTRDENGRLRRIE